MQSEAKRTNARILIALAVAWLAVSTSAVAIVFAQPLHPLVIATGRLAVSTGLWAFMARRELRRLPSALSVPGVRGSVILGGVILAGHFAAWTWCLQLTSIAHGAVLVATQPIFAGLLARLIGDRAGMWLYVGTAVAISGTVLMTTGTPLEPGPAPLLGDLIAIVAALLAALYLLIGRKVTERVSLAAYLTTLNAVSTLCLGLVVLALGAELLPPGVGWPELLAVLWLGLVPGFVGHGLMNWSSRRVPVHVVSLVVLVEPVGAILLAWIFLSQGVTLREVCGGGLLLAGAGLVLMRSRSAPITEDPGS